MGFTQFTFTLRLLSGVKSVHLLGSWDDYTTTLPLTKSRTSSSPIKWKGTFKFPAATLQPGKCYWYYFIVDGYKITYDPKQPHVTEPTTKRILNILNVPREKSYLNSTVKQNTSRNLTSDTARFSYKNDLLHERSSSASYRRRYSRDSAGLTLEIPRGRPLSISEIQSPKPITPHATKFILEADYSAIAIEEMTSQFNTATIDRYYYSPSESLSSSSSNSLFSHSDRDSPSSASSVSQNNSPAPNSCSSCEGYTNTQRGEWLKPNFCSSRCGYIDDSGSCYSSEEGIPPNGLKKYGLAT